MKMTESQSGGYAPQFSGGQFSAHLTEQHMQLRLQAA
jgi:hypothetical protein